MRKADKIFIDNINNILENGVWSENARPKYKSGVTANSKYITGAFAEYDLSKGEFPITTLRPIAIKSAIKELLWIYQEQTSDLAVLEEKYGVKYWSEWEVGDSGHIGLRYGATVKIVPIDVKEISSTSVRETVRRADDISSMVPEGVDDYIWDHYLYYN